MKRFDLVPTATESSNRRSVMATLFALATAGHLAGCSGGQRAAPVNASLARESLTTVLESWKRGDPIDALKTGSPPIVAQDMDWMAGARLLNYDVSPTGKDDDANLIIPVQLTLRNGQGKEVRKSVKYLVGTSPSITVFRDFP